MLVDDVGDCLDDLISFAVTDDVFFVAVVEVLPGLGLITDKVEDVLGL